MSEKEGHVPGIAWMAVCLLALGIGFYLGRLQQPPPAKGTEPDVVASKTSDVVLTEHTITNIAKEASKWVVTLEAESKDAESAEHDHIIPGLTPVAPPARTGAGMIVRPDGYIVTSNHVLGVDKKLSVILRNGKRYSPRIVGRDWVADIAVLKIEAADLPYARFADSKLVEPGDWAIAIGTPMRLADTVSLGIVSALGRSISNAPNIDLIQTDAAINPGNSGGPLLNIHGKVIGMNAAMNRRAQNIAFAVPSDEVRTIVDTLIRDGRIDRGYLGLLMRDSGRETPGASQGKGVYVVISRPDSSAAKAGIEPGDVIQSVNSTPVHDLTDMTRIIMDCRAGQRINLKIDRHGQLQSISLPLDDVPDEVAPGIFGY